MPHVLDSTKTKEGVGTAKLPFSDPWPMPEAIVDDGLYTVEEVAQLLRIGRTKAYELVSGKKIESIQLGDRPGSAIRILGLKIREFLDRSVY